MPAALEAPLRRFAWHVPHAQTPLLLPLPASDVWGPPLPPGWARVALLLPCRAAVRGRFPLAGTYFQVRTPASYPLLPTSCWLAPTSTWSHTPLIWGACFRVGSPLHAASGWCAVRTAV